MARLTRLRLGAVALPLALACTPRPELPPPRTPLVATPAEPFRAARPASAPDEPFAVPPVDQRRLANGLEVWTLPRPTWPAVRMTVVSRGPSTRTEPRLAGLATLMAEVIERAPDPPGGRRGRDGTDVAAAVGERALTLTLDATAAESRDAFRKLARTARAPRWSESLVEEARLDQLYRIRHGQLQPLSLARSHALERLFGRWHPLTSPTDGLFDVVRGFQLDQVSRYHAATVGPESSALVVVGDVDPDDVAAWAEEELGSWQRKSAPLARPAVDPEPPDPRARRLRVVDTFSGGEALLAVVNPAPSLRSRDHAAFEVLAQLFGGGISSRLGARLREGSGYTYTAASFYEAHPDEGVLLTVTSVEPDVAGRTLRMIVDEMAALAAGPIEPEELEAARRVVRERWISRFDTVWGAANALSSAYAEELGPEDIGRLERGIAGTTAEDVQRLARRHLAESEAVFVVVGSLYRFGTSLYRAGFRDFDLFQRRFED